MQKHPMRPVGYSRSNSSLTIDMSLVSSNASLMSSNDSRASSSDLRVSSDSDNSPTELKHTASQKDGVMSIDIHDILWDFVNKKEFVNCKTKAELQKKRSYYATYLLKYIIQKSAKSTGIFKPSDIILVPNTAVDEIDLYKQQKKLFDEHYKLLLVNFY